MSNTPPKSTAEVRRLNRNRVYRYLYSATNAITKQDLAYELSMSMPTLTQNLNDLLAQGLIDYSGTADSTCGRRPRIISVVPGARYAIGVELTSGHIRIVAINLLVHELAAQRVTKAFDPSEEYAIELQNLIERFIMENGIDPARLLGVGITVPGIVDNKQEIISNAPTLHIKHLSTKLLTDHIRYPVNLTNDATAGGFAEWWNRTDIGDMAYLSVGRGVGGAILIAGVPYLGHFSRSGEFGHMCIHPKGLKCNCGRLGCLEAYCSTSKISDDLGITLEQFFQSLEAGNQEYSQLWDSYLDDLVIGIRNINSTLDCGIVLGGKLSQFLAGHLTAIDQRLRETDPNYREVPYFSICRYHTQASGIGAALYFVDQFICQI